MNVADVREAAHEPERDARQLAVGIRDKFQNRDERAEEARNNDAAQNQRDRRRHLRDSARKIAETDREQRKGKGSNNGRFGIC